MGVGRCRSAPLEGWTDIAGHRPSPLGHRLGVEAFDYILPKISVYITSYWENQGFMLQEILTTNGRANWDVQPDRRDTQQQRSLQHRDGDPER